MNSPESPVDHFSDEAMSIYTALLQARELAASQSIAHRRLVTAGADWFHYDAPSLVNYRDALGAVTDLYLHGYRRQQRTDTEIKEALLPSLAGEHRLFGDHEAKLFWSDGTYVEQKAKLYEGQWHDRAHIAWHVGEYAVHQSVGETILGTIHRISAVIVDRAHHDRG